MPFHSACPTAAELDELRSCLQYAAAVSPALGIGLGRACSGTFGVEATDPDIRFVLDVGESVWVRDEAPATASAPCLRGDAVSLIEALSLRAGDADVDPDRMDPTARWSGHRVRRRLTA